jgi:adenine-specific DNA-methyltransferase
MGLYLGDSLEILKKIKEKHVHLVYIDPPFFTQKTQKTDSNQYDDKWEDLQTYLNYMDLIIEQLHRILKNNGTMYLHCDYRASHYLKTLMDKHFEYENFRVEILWLKTVTGNLRKGNFLNKHESIFYYVKDKENYTFNPQRIPLSKRQIERDFTHIEKETGRRYKTNQLLKSGNKPKVIIFKDRGKYTAPDGYRFSWTQKTYDKRIEQNPNCIHWTTNNTPRVKQYLDDSLKKGNFPTNIWDDISNLQVSHKEWVNYPNQKPRKLLERIIKTSSNDGDTVLDCFMGSGTTCVVAKQNRRKYIGIDKNPKSHSVCKERLKTIKVYENLLNMSTTHT